MIESKTINLIFNKDLARPSLALSSPLFFSASKKFSGVCAIAWLFKPTTKIETAVTTIAKRIMLLLKNFSTDAT